MKQCAVLIINCQRPETTHCQALERIGFRVVETSEWPADDLVREFQVVIVAFRHMASVSMLAARMRAKPHFGHRVLIALAPTTASTEERHTAVGSGFDDVVCETGDSRLLIARILRRLRARPEHRCFLPDRKRTAA